MNKSDTERITSVMTSAGYQPAPLREADLVIFNTCSVRQTAEDRAAGQIREAKKRRQQVVVTGCLKNQDSFVKKNTAVDFYIDINDIQELPEILKGKKSENNANNYFEIKPTRTSPAQAYVPIMTGCNNFCSYCIVPHVRGRERSRPLTNILEEIKDLAQKNYRQITLLGQNVNSYKNNDANFPDLLEKIVHLDGDFRVFFVTSHPKDMSLRLIDLVAKYDRLCPYFHVPIQSGSDRILRKMNRGYTMGKYTAIINSIRQQIPGAAITTDIIVGYPGESTADFEETKKACTRFEYDLAYIARFSPRPGTAAEKEPDNITPTEKKRREQVLTEIVTQTAMAQNSKHVGRECQVLVEKSLQNDSTFENYGKNEYFKTVRFTSNSDLSNQMTTVRITKALPWGLEGEKCNE